MSMDDYYDIAVIGAGQAGIPLVRSFAKAGYQVALIEKKEVGGSCVNFGCTPTKAAIASAHVAHMARNAAAYGVMAGDVQVDFPGVLQRARAIVNASRVSLEASLAAPGNLHLIHGRAQLLGRTGDGFRLAINSASGARPMFEIRAREVVLDTGTRSLIPPIEGIDGVNFLHSENWLDHDVLPARLLVVGGGYIGLEMAQFYSRMGSTVSVVQAAGQIAEREDDDVADRLQAFLEDEGITFHTGTKVTRVRAVEGGGIVATLDGPAGIHHVEASHLFIASGRRPNTDGLGLETVGIEPTEQGTIGVDQRLSTRVDGLWALGDIRGGPMFTHTAWDDFRIVESQILGDGSRTLDRIVPYAMFTDPELARVGIGENEAQKSGMNVKIGRFELHDSGKAREIGRTEGFIKVVVDADSGLLLGATLLCADAAELVNAYVQIMNAGAPAAVMENAIHIHPTLAEALQSAIAAAH